MLHDVSDIISVGFYHVFFHHNTTYGFIRSCCMRVFEPRVTLEAAWDRGNVCLRPTRPRPFQQLCRLWDLLGLGGGVAVDVVSCLNKQSQMPSVVGLRFSQ